MPWQKTDPKGAEQLIVVDIEALSGHLDVLFNSFVNAGAWRQFEGVLDATREAVDDERWRQRWLSHKAFWQMGAELDESAGRKTLVGITDPDSIVDMNLLTLYIDLFSYALAPSVMISLCRRARSLSTQPGVKFQYSMLIAIQDLKAGHIDEAKSQIKKAIDEEKSAIENSDELHGKFMLGQAFLLLGQLDDDRSQFVESHRLFVRTDRGSAS